jgi:transcriptional regulator with XRE-family HTH domain
MDVQKLPEVIGANYRKIRTEHGVSQAHLATHARRIGLKWNSARVADFERGRSRSPFGDVLAAVLALDNSIGEGHGPLTVYHADGTRTRRPRPRVRLADLVAHDGYVELVEGFAPTGEAVQRVCQGRPWELLAHDTYETSDVTELLSPAPGVCGRHGMTVGQVADMRARSDRTEAKVARDLGVSEDTLLALSWKVFAGRTFTEERKRRGRVPAAQTAVLRQELREEYNRGNY